MPTGSTGSQPAVRPTRRSRPWRSTRATCSKGLGHECFAAERERLSDVYEDLLVAVAHERLERGDVAGARRAATELLARDPLREEAHTALIALYGRSGAARRSCASTAGCAGSSASGCR